MISPLKKKIDLAQIPVQGKFGTQRKFDIHTGVDIYCNEGEKVYAMEAGTVINVSPFTGQLAESPWWNNTQAVLIEGASGVILYGELNPSVFIGQKIQEGDLLGTIMTVLKKDKGLPMTMLHLELYSSGYRGDGEWWKDEKPPQLLNVESLLKKLTHKQ